MWLIQYDPPGGPSIFEDYDTEAQANARADWLIKGANFKRVVIFEVADGEEVA